MKFAVGVIAFGGKSSGGSGSGVGGEFMKAYYEKSLVVEGFKNWFHDQIALYEVWTEWKDRVKLYELGESEHSIADTLDTIVYSRRLNNKVKLNEILKMRGIVLANINFGDIRMAYA